jgi:hypothetical protein
MTHLKASNNAQLDNHPVQVCEIFIGAATFKVSAKNMNWSICRKSRRWRLDRRDSPADCADPPVFSAGCDNMRESNARVARADNEPHAHCVRKEFASKFCDCTRG